MAGAWLAGRVADQRDGGRWPARSAARPDDNASAGLLLLIGAVVASPWLGRRSAGFTGWPRRLHRLGTAGLLLFGSAVLVDVDRNASSDVYSGYEQTSVDRRYDRIEDVFVYDQQGRLIRDAQLFDQNGVPIRLGWPNCLDSSGAVPAPRNAYPYCPELAPFGAPASPSIAPPAPAPTGSATSTAPTPTAPSTSASRNPRQHARARDPARSWYETALIGRNPPRSRGIRCQAMAAMSPSSK
ncbi:hypothetical protein V2I01_19580 [Micromonospora sp. BRA006-A]|nr:hypothetical protein [Micromonospora sp. BRA006-A]